MGHKRLEQADYAKRLLEQAQKSMVRLQFSQQSDYIQVSFVLRFKLVSFATILPLRDYIKSEMFYLSNCWFNSC